MGTLCKNLGCELQTSIEDLKYVYKNLCYPKMKKIEKMIEKPQKSRGQVQGINI